MSKNNRKKFISLFSVLSLFVLASCDDDHIRYPKDYEDKLFDVKDDVYSNDKENYYGSLSTSDINSKTLDNILVDISKVAHNYKGYQDGEDVSKAIKYQENSTVSIQDSYEKYSTATPKDDNIETRAKKQMTDTILGGSYTKNGLYYEEQYARYLKESYYYLDKSIESDSTKDGKFILPSYKYDDIFTTALNEPRYKQYRERESYDQIRINYLTAEYIKTKNYPAIGNTNARKVQVIGLADRSDDVGAAQRLLDAYVRDYIVNPKDGLSDPNFLVLQRLWKGITSDAATAIAPSRYPNSVILTTAEEQWLRDNKILPSDKKDDANASSTLLGKVLKDKKKLESSGSEWYNVNDALESQYSGSYAYSTEKGFRDAVDEIAKRNLINEGIYLKSSGISGLPTALTDRIFDTKLTNDKTKINKMKEKDADGKFKGNVVDTSKYCNDGFRYLTSPDKPADADDSIIFYDSESKTYYLTRILDVVDTNGLSLSSASNSIYNEEQKEQLAREVAYEMSTTGSYKSNSIVYWLSRTDLSFTDDEFLKYIEDNYKDVFKTENPYKKDKSEPKIVLYKK